MRVAVASGKGGTGKTTVTLGLALTSPGPVEVLDADVEAPNLALFLRPHLTGSRPVTVPMPVVDPESCDGCGACSAACAFNALACLGGPPVVFADLCHGCGACRLVCPRAAISETTREVGSLDWGEAGDAIRFTQGRLNVGEAKAPPVIDAVRARADGAGLTLIDCPPGTACSFVAAVRGADLVLLVTEPTPFGLADLELAMEALQQLRLPFGVVVNRAGSGEERVAEVCGRSGARVLGSIPDDRRIAEAYARGTMPVHEVPWLRPLFEGLHREIARVPTSDRPQPEASHAHT